MVAAGVFAVIVLVAGAARADSDNRGSYELRATTTEAGTVTGLSFRIVYRNPSDPDAKPPPITSASFELPEGTRIDGAAVPACEAGDEELRARGREACPAGSRVGTGTLWATTGFGPPLDPVEADVVVFNGGDQLVEVVFAKGTNSVLGMDRLDVRGSKLTAHPPATPGGPPDGRTSIRRIDLDLPARRGADGQPFVTTPPTCPADGRWRSRAHYGFADGGKTTLSSQTPCVVSAGHPRRPTARVSVTPRRVTAFRRVRFRFRATGACGRRAIVRFAGRRARTDRRGRTAMRLRLGRTGRRPVTLRKAGCTTARTFVRVLPAG